MRSLVVWLALSIESTNHGNRYVYLPATTTPSQPLLVLMGGMAQTIASWEPHLPFLSGHRNILVYEGIGQGPDLGNVNDAYVNVSLPFQADVLLETLNAIDEEAYKEKVDVVGFSLGGRIAMAMTTRHPQRIRRIHVTGVAADRSDAGHVAAMAWRDLLAAGNTQGFAWSILQTTYAPAFLLRHQNRLTQWTHFIANNNSPRGLSALMEQTYFSKDDLWTPLAMAKRIQQQQDPIGGRLLVGELDQIAPCQETQLLASMLEWQFSTMKGCGHAVPTENARLWRKDVLNFLKSN